MTEYEHAKNTVSELLRADLIKHVYLSTDKIKKALICLYSGENITYYGDIATKIAVYIFKNEFRKIDM